MDRRGNIVRKPGKRSRDIKQETMYLNQEFTEKQSRMIFMPQAQKAVRRVIRNSDWTKKNNDYFFKQKEFQKDLGP